MSPAEWEDGVLSLRVAAVATAMRLLVRAVLTRRLHQTERGG